MAPGRKSSIGGGGQLGITAFLASTPSAGKSQGNPSSGPSTAGGSTGTVAKRKMEGNESGEHTVKAFRMSVDLTSPTGIVDAQFTTPESLEGAQKASKTDGEECSVALHTSKALDTPARDVKMSDALPTSGASGSSSSSSSAPPPQPAASATAADWTQYLGAKVRKYFEGHGWFVGEVKEFKPLEGGPEQGLWYVVYEDGDHEDMDTEELLKGIEAMAQGDEDPSEDVDMTEEDEQKEEQAQAPGFPQRQTEKPEVVVIDDASEEEPQSQLQQQELETTLPDGTNAKTAKPAKAKAKRSRSKASTKPEDAMAWCPDGWTVQMVQATEENKAKKAFVQWTAPDGKMYKSKAWAMRRHEQDTKKPQGNASPTPPATTVTTSATAASTRTTAATSKTPKEAPSPSAKSVASMLASAKPRKSTMKPSANATEGPTAVSTSSTAETTETIEVVDAATPPSSQPNTTEAPASSSTPAIPRTQQPKAKKAKAKASPPKVLEPLCEEAAEKLKVYEPQLEELVAAYAQTVDDRCDKELDVEAAWTDLSQRFQKGSDSMQVDTATPPAAAPTVEDLVPLMCRMVQGSPDGCKAVAERVHTFLQSKVAELETRVSGDGSGREGLEALCHLAQSVTVAAISSKLLMVAERKAFGAFTRKASTVVNEDTSTYAMWHWDVISADKFTTDSTTVIAAQRTERQRVGRHAKALKKLLDVIQKRPFDASKVAIEEDRVAKLAREQEVRRVKHQEKMAKEAEKAKAAMQRQAEKEAKEEKKRQEREAREEKAKEKLLAQQAKEEAKAKQQLAAQHQRQKFMGFFKKASPEKSGGTPGAASSPTTPMSSAAQSGHGATAQDDPMDGTAVPGETALIANDSSSMTATTAIATAIATTTNTSTATVSTVGGVGSSPTAVGSASKASTPTAPHFDLEAFEAELQARPSKDAITAARRANACSRRRRLTRSQGSEDRPRWVRKTVSMCNTEKVEFGEPVYTELVEKTFRNKMKLLQFQEDQRPPWWGTWSRTSNVVTGRRPLGQDHQHFDYDHDSEAEWEEEEPGESLSGSENEDEDEKDNLDYGDGWLRADDDFGSRNGMDEDAGEGNGVVKSGDADRNGTAPTTEAPSMVGPFMRGAGHDVIPEHLEVLKTYAAVVVPSPKCDDADVEVADRVMPLPVDITGAIASLKPPEPKKASSTEASGERKKASASPPKPKVSKLVTEEQMPKLVELIMSSKDTLDTMVDNFSQMNPGPSKKEIRKKIRELADHHGRAGWTLKLETYTKLGLPIPAPTPAPATKAAATAPPSTPATSPPAPVAVQHKAPSTGDLTANASSSQPSIMAAFMKPRQTTATPTTTAKRARSPSLSAPKEDTEAKVVEVIDIDATDASNEPPAKKQKPTEGGLVESTVPSHAPLVLPTAAMDERAEPMQEDTSS